jgi:hypothetical protein
MIASPLLLTRDFPDDCQIGLDIPAVLDIPAFSAFLQDRGELRTAKDKALSSVAQSQLQDANQRVIRRMRAKCNHRYFTCFLPCFLADPLDEELPWSPPSALAAKDSF